MTDPVKLAIDALVKCANFLEYNHESKKQASERIDVVIKELRALQSQPAPEVVDLDALKRECFTRLNTMFFGKNFNDRDVINATIDHLATTGRIAGIERCREGGE